VSRRPSTAPRAVAVALLVALTCATTGQGRVVAAVGSESWDASPDNAALCPAARSEIRPGRPSEGSAPTRMPVATLPAQACGPSRAARSFGAPSPIVRHLARRLFEAERTSRGPPARPIA
jgi:hypothetical protein